MFERKTNTPKEYSSHKQISPVKSKKIESFVECLLPTEEGKKCIVPQLHSTVLNVCSQGQGLAWYIKIDGQSVLAHNVLKDN